MSQLSLFSAEARPTSLADLGGMLCGPGRILRFGGGITARLSLDLADSARAREVRAAAAPFGLAFEAGERSCAGRELRTAYRRDLAVLAREWTGTDRGKTVPAGFQLDGTALRLWVLASGRPDGRGGYLLPLDGAAPGTHDPLIAATTRLGLPPARVTLAPCPECAEPVDPADRRHPDDPPEATAPPSTRGTAPRLADPEDDSPDPDGLPVVDLAGSASEPGPVLVDLTHLPEPAGPAPLPTCPDHHRGPECRRAGPALRITGVRRMQRLVELVGPPPEGVDPAGWPQYRGLTWG
ncbi:hypothetical protein [Pseudonocardia xishanensis]|uniref:hypothetical protein n=1 Tax=Pseudonocardia xishanensis TaxID=630995 RepID=UPI0031E77705